MDLIAAFRLFVRTLPIHFALLGRKRKYIKSKTTAKLVRQTNLDRRGLRPIPIICHLLDPPSFSLPTTFKFFPSIQTSMRFVVFTLRQRFTTPLLQLRVLCENCDAARWRCVFATNYCIQIADTGFAEYFLDSHIWYPPISLNTSVWTTQSETYRAVVEIGLDF